MKREQDPKKIRERATEEGRLGEEALRRLMDSGLVTHSEGNVSTLATKLPLRRRREMLWKSTMEAVAAVDSSSQQGRNLHDPGGMEIDENCSDNKVHFGSAINAERMYWRKVSARSTPKEDEMVIPAGNNN